MESLNMKLKKLWLLIYMKTWVLATLWTTFMIILAILYNYYNCVEKLNILSLEIIGGTALFLFIINITIILIFAVFQRSKIKKNMKNNLKPLTSVTILEGADKLHLYTSKKNYINVLPLYLIAIYSLSKIIIYLVDFFGNKETIYIGIDSIMIWTGLFFGAGFLWLKLKKYAHEDARYSIGYTIFVSIVTVTILYWNMLVPYFIEISMLVKCIAKSI